MPQPEFPSFNVAGNTLGYRPDQSRDVVLDLETPASFEHQEALQSVAENIVRAKKEGSGVVMMMGGHVIRSGVQKYIIDLMARGYISCLAMNGSGVIHDFELAQIMGPLTERLDLQSGATKDGCRHKLVGREETI